jgi:iron(III) transport system permease protein
MELARFVRRIRRELDGWRLTSLGWAAVLLLPFLFIFSAWFRKPNEQWLQIRSYLLKDYVAGTVQLTVLTGLLTAFLGVSLAWLVAAHDFPLRRFFRWALLLPLAIPPYIAAYTYSNMLSYTGVVQKTLRDLGVEVSPKWLAFGSMRGALFSFALFLYPYVYLIARAFMERQCASWVESARLLGARPLTVFWRVALPMARPAVAGGAALAVYEVLGDYGVTSYFGIRTLTTGIFQTWFGMYDVESAMRLASWLMAAVVGLFFLERWLRRGRLYHISGRPRPMAPVRLRGGAAVAASAFCFIVFALGFLIPVVQLVAWASLAFEDVWKPAFWRWTMNTVAVAAVAAFAVTSISLVVANVCRRRTVLNQLLARWVTAGYAMPGAVIAIGILAVFIGLDGLLAPLYAAMGWGDRPLVLSTSVAMLVLGYVIRFTATGYNPVEAGYENIGARFSESARLLGHGRTRTFFRVEAPLLRGSIAVGFLLTFVEICKELPLALLLRPFNFETLATQTYRYAKDEQIILAAFPSLLVIAVSLLSVAVLHMAERRA